MVHDAPHNRTCAVFGKKNLFQLQKEDGGSIRAIKDGVFLPLAQ